MSSVTRFAKHQATVQAQSVGHRAVDQHQWHLLYRIGAWSAILTLLTIPAQIMVYVIMPPPETVIDWLILFQENPWQGLLNLDLIYLINQVLMVPVFLALYAALRAVNPSIALFGLGVGLFAIAVHTTSNPSIDMWLLSRTFANAPSEASRTALLAAGDLLMIRWTGTAYTLGYIVAAIAFLAMSWAMWRSRVFGRWLAGSGIIMAVTMFIPPTFGPIGLIFAFLSTIPTFIWLALLARRLLQMANGRPEVNA